MTIAMGRWVRLVAALTVLAATPLFSSRTADAWPAASVDAPLPDLETLCDADAWIRLNDMAFTISNTEDGRCAYVRPDYVGGRATIPHMNAAINVYVNPIGKAAMWALGRERFPVGSVLVKEKFYLEENPNGPDKASLYTVMIKRDAGYAPDVGDWEFAVVSGDRRSVIGRGQMENCVSCHQHVASTDYVFVNFYRGKHWPPTSPN